MNATLTEMNHPSIEYYDSDYPSKNFSNFPENFDEIVIFQGLSDDVDFYESVARRVDGDILELCCGTGRVSIPLAIAGFNVTGVDFSGELLKQFDQKVCKLATSARERIALVNQDIVKLNLEKKDFGLAICAFNSLLCLTEFADQLAALRNAARHLKSGGILLLDMMNPLILNLQGDTLPRPFYTRRHPLSGNIYTRFAAMGAMNEKQVQKLFGWYDEVNEQGLIRRRHYEMHWRPVFRYEIELMLDKTGFRLEKVFGGHKGEPFSPTSRKMIIEAVKL